MKKSMRLLVLTHEELVPPESIEGLTEKQIQPFKKEYDVGSALRALGHEVRILGVAHDLLPIRAAVEEWEPELVFNLLMEFQDVAVFQAHVTSYLELLHVPYAGCNPNGLILARNKALSKKIFRYHRIPTPAFTVFPMGRDVRKLRGLRFPLIVKALDEEASLGISQASVVHDEEHLRERVEFVHRRVRRDAIAEEFVQGRELTVGVLGNERLRVFPTWEMFFEKLPEGTLPIATARVKWDQDYQKRMGIDTGRARDLDPALEVRIARLARRIYRCLEMSGYGRIDLRLTSENQVYVIEANPNPDLSQDEDFAHSAAAAGLPYPALLERIVSLGLKHRTPWQVV